MRRRLAPDTLDRYVLSQFMGYLGISLLLFIGLFVVVDFFEKLDKFVDAEATAGLIARYYTYWIPYVLVLVAPIGLLLASLLTLGQFGRTGELIAMLSNGRSYLRIIYPIIVFSGLMCVVSFCIGDFVMPGATVRREAILKGREGRPRHLERQRHVTYIGRDSRLYYAKTIDARRRILREVVAQRFDEDKNLVERIDAREAAKDDGVWTFRRGVLRVPHDERELATAFERFLTSRIPETVEDLLRIEPEPDAMSTRSLAAYIRRLDESGARTRKYQVALQLKLAIPVVNLIIVLLGTSLVLRLPRSGFAVGFGIAIFISFAYMMIVRAGQALGYTGALPPYVAAWLGNAIFLLIAIGFQARAHR